MTKLFVYGTLKRGFHNNYLLNDWNYLGNSMTLDRNWMLLSPEGYGFPYLLHGLVRGEFAHHVYGELYETKENDPFHALDMLEGVDHNHYVREQIKCVYFGNGVVEAYTYVASRSTHKYVFENTPNKSKLLLEDQVEVFGNTYYIYEWRK